MKPRIVCAANKLFFLENEPIIITGARHWDSIMHQTIDGFDEYLLSTKTGEEQGFIDQFGKFYTREEAWPIAEDNNQIVRRVGGDGHRLYSENLY